VTNSVQNSAKVDRKVDGWISDLVGALADPIIVMPGGWGADLPDWIREQIQIERMLENMKSIKGEEMLGTDAEVVAYLFTASLTAPIPTEWVEIYLYISDKLYKRKNKQGLPADLHVVEKLSQSQERDLLHFRRWLYNARVKARQDKERGIRREEKLEVAKPKAAKKKQATDLQPRMFDF
jgi:hypothetical protein